MQDTATSNKRIAKNTILLYIRTFFVMLISLYTSRAILDALGETDFGIYNLVGGIVVLFSFMNSAMTTATQRFLNYELGKGNTRQVKRVFSMSLTAHICIAFLILILGETLGLWFVLTQLNIPLERYEASIWVYHLSLIGCCVNILRIPYSACIIAYERMSFFAYVSILESVLKLMIVFMLAIAPIDALVFYAVLMLVVICVVNSLYILYCNHKFDTARYHFFWDKLLFKQLMFFSGWSMFGSLASTGVAQGMNILLNIFYGVVLNAALGISHQVHSAVSSFVSSFQTAFSPQIVKTYAAGQKNDLEKLICRTSRFSYCLVFIFAPAIIVCITPILETWLTIVPEYTREFTIVTILLCMIDALSGPLWVSVQATGEIRNYQLLLSFISLLNLPFMYVMLLLGISPIWVVGIRVIIAVIIHFVRVGYLGHKMNFPVIYYMRDVMIRVTIMTCISIPLCIILSHYTNRLFLSAIVFALIVLQNSILSFVVGMSRNERSHLILIVKEKIKRI